MTAIWDRLYLGSLRDADLLVSFNPCAIVSVLSLCEQTTEHRTTAISYRQIPIADTRPISAEKFEQIMTAITNGIRRGNLLLHCLAGASRSPIMAAAWMHRCGYAGIDRALAEIAALRDIDPSPVLLKSTKEHLTR